MTKKHFILLADVLHDSRPDSGGEALRQRTCDVNMLATALARTYPRFNSSLWLYYIDGKCGPNGGTVLRLEDEL